MEQALRYKVRIKWDQELLHLAKMEQQGPDLPYAENEQCARHLSEIQGDSDL